VIYSSTIYQSFTQFFLFILEGLLFPIVTLWSLILAIETASYLSDLNISNPPGSDPIGQADDHIRLLKSVLKSTFPNITGAVTSTQLQLNYGVVPTGAIIMWSGATTSIPSGWALCNGQTAAKSDGSGNVTVPDLRDRFIVGAGTSYSVGATGGSTSNTPTITMNNAGTALSVSNLPNYNLSVSDPSHAHGVYDPGHSHTYTVVSSTGQAIGGSGSNYYNGATTAGTGGAGTGIGIYGAYTGISVNSAGGNAAHSHANTATSSAVSTLSPYYALCFIYKL
jgi:hypothetical protein